MKREQWGFHGIDAGELVKKLRTSGDTIVTQPELASAVGVSQNYISIIERGSKVPSKALMNRILDFFQMTDEDVLQLMGFTEKDFVEVSCGNSKMTKLSFSKTMANDVVSMMMWQLLRHTDQSVDDLSAELEMSPTEFIDLLKGREADQLFKNPDKLSRVCEFIAIKECIATAQVAMDLNATANSLRRFCAYSILSYRIQSDLRYLNFSEDQFLGEVPRSQDKDGLIGILKFQENGIDKNHYFIHCDSRIKIPFKSEASCEQTLVDIALWNCSASHGVSPEQIPYTSESCHTDTNNERHRRNMYRKELDRLHDLVISSNEFYFVADNSFTLPVLLEQIKDLHGKYPFPNNGKTIHLLYRIETDTVGTNYISIPWNQ